MKIVILSLSLATQDSREVFWEDFHLHYLLIHKLFT